VTEEYVEISSLAVQGEARCRNPGGGRRVHQVSTRRCCAVVNLNCLLEGCSKMMEAGVGGGVEDAGDQPGRARNLGHSPDLDPPRGEPDPGETSQEQP
jgi:hypothetical protein